LYDLNLASNQVKDNSV